MREVSNFYHFLNASTTADTIHEKRFHEEILTAREPNTWSMRILKIPSGVTARDTAKWAAICIAISTQPRSIL
jgi:hypothetical protein